MIKLSKITARQILDSRGNPTLEVDAYLQDGSMGRAAVPSGASTGIHEVLEKRDGQEEHFLGKGVEDAVRLVENEIFEAIKDMDAGDQVGLDEAMIALDGTEQLKKLGGNSILAVSLAVSKAVANYKKIPYYQYVHQLFAAMGATVELKVPVPMFNILNGGAHTDWQSTDIQEFMVVPHAAPNMQEAVEMGSEIYHHLEKILISKKMSTLVGDEGGFAPELENDKAALDLVVEAIQAAGFKPGQEVSIALDVAASEFFKQDEGYVLPIQGKTLDSTQMIEYIMNLTQEYPLMSVEDGLDQDDWSNWPELTQKLDKIFSVGDDLLVTNPERIDRAILEKTCDALLLKVNQVGSLTMALRAAKLALDNNWQVVVSHRSGETEDTTIADLAVGIGAGYIKSGSLARSDRTAKYNQLMRIEEQLNG